MSAPERLAPQAAGPPVRLLNRNFVLLSQGQIVSQLGDQAFAVATLFWSLGASGSASVMSLVMAAALVPIVLLSPVAGAIADRHSRVRIIVLCDAGRGALMLLLALCFWRYPTQWLIPILLSVVFANGILTAFFEAAITAAIPDLAPDRLLASANSLHLFSRQGSALAGQALGGIAFQAIGAPLLFFVNGLTFAFSGACAAFVRVPGRAGGTAGDTVPTATFVASIRQGLRYVVERDGLLRFIAAIAVFNSLIMAIATLLPIYVSDCLGEGPRWYGFLVAGLSAGAIVGSASAGLLKARGLALVSLFCGMGGVLALLGQTRIPEVALMLMVSAGAFAGAIGVTVLTILQRTTPADFRGRVLGLNVTMTRALTPIGILAAGIVADRTARNIPLIYAACGVLAAGTAVVLLASPRGWAFVAAGGSGEANLERPGSI